MRCSGRRASSRRLQELQAAEDREGSNTYETYLKFAERIKEFVLGLKAKGDATAAVLLTPAQLEADL